MLSATLQQGLSEYAVGEKMRALRLKKKMGLVELGKHTGSLAGAALEDRARASVSHPADTAAHRARVQRRTRVFLFWFARQAARCRGAESRSRRLAGPAGRARNGLSVRVARLSGNGAAIQRVLRRIFSGATGAAAATFAPGRRVHLHAAGHVERSHRRRRTCAAAGRLDVLRRNGLTCVPAQRRTKLPRRRRDRSIARPPGPRGTLTWRRRWLSESPLAGIGLRPRHEKAE